jgi:hypothetical protein
MENLFNSWFITRNNVCLDDDGTTTKGKRWIPGRM